MTKTEATRAVKNALRAAGLVNYPVGSQAGCCGGVELTAVHGEPELIREALASLSGVKALRETPRMVAVVWEEQS